MKQIPVGLQPFEMIYSVETSFMKVPCWSWTSTSTEPLFISGRAAFSRFSFATWPLSNNHRASCLCRSTLRSLFQGGSEIWVLFLRLGQVDILNIYSPVYYLHQATIGFFLSAVDSSSIHHSTWNETLAVSLVKTLKIKLEKPNSWVSATCTWRNVTPSAWRIPSYR